MRLQMLLAIMPKKSPAAAPIMIPAITSPK